MTLRYAWVMQLAHCTGLGSDVKVCFPVMGALKTSTER